MGISQTGWISLRVKKALIYNLVAFALASVYVA